MVVDTQEAQHQHQYAEHGAQHLQQQQQPVQTPQGQGPPPPPQSNSGSSSNMDNKWMLRLRDLEFKLKAEREGRILDRGEAIKRINASESENMMLRENLEREKRRRGG